MEALWVPPLPDIGGLEHLYGGKHPPRTGGVRRVGQWLHHQRCVGLRSFLKRYGQGLGP